MKFNYHKNNMTMERHYHIVIEERELSKARFDRFDNALLNEINMEKIPKVSDVLLGLELVARKIEESKNDQT